MTNSLFEVHKLNDIGLSNAAEIAGSFTSLLEDLKDAGCDMKSREFALCRTHLEIAAFYAKKSMAIRKDMQDD